MSPTNIKPISLRCADIMCSVASASASAPAFTGAASHNVAGLMAGAGAIAAFFL